MSTSLEVFADVAELTYPAMRSVLLHEAENHDLPVLSQDEGRIFVGTEEAAFGITPAEGAGIRLHVSARDKDMLTSVREEVLSHLSHLVPDIAKTIRWSDSLVEGARPANFQFATVVSSSVLCADFLRLELAVDALETYSDASIHFRFVLPQCDDPEWPSLKANGSIHWPSGDKVLHRPVYTVRYLDKKAGRITVDVYRHDGGRIMEWTKAAQPGDSIGLLGPAGGGVPESKDLILCGDETAFPAIARILQALPEDGTAQVFLHASSGASDYPLPKHAGVSLTWVGAGDDLVALVQDAFQQNPDRFFWFAADAVRVTKIRAYAAAQDIPKEARYLATFWTPNAN
ncbi:MAG: siderophore-interacting protein [Pelagimonas sp.]